MNKTKIVVWVIAAAVVVGLGALILAPQGGGGVQNVDDARMQQLVNEGVRVVDVRTAGEYDVGHIPGADNVPISEFEAAAATWDPAQPIALYCATGERSIQAVQYLEQLGFQTIYHFNAGLIAYTGSLDSGTMVAQAPATETLDSPVLYEFYTDW